VPKLRNLRLTSLPEAVDAYLNPAHLLLLTNLSSLDIRFNERSIPILASVGHQLKSLTIWPTDDGSLGESCVHLQNAFALCPNLEFFGLKSYTEYVYLMEAGIVLPEATKLKILFVNGFFFGVRGLFPFLLSAPQLEDVRIEINHFSVHETETLTTLLSEERIFQNVTKVDLCVGWKLKYSSKLFKIAMQNLVSHIISFSPRLQILELQLGDQTGEYTFRINSTLAGCLAQVRKM